MLLLWVWLCSMVYAESKHALLIGVSEYPYIEVPTIYTDYEVRQLAQEKHQQGYKKEHVQVLLDEQATKKGIVDAWSKMIDTLERGDEVYIHFSGHGGVVKDLDGDELTDSYDEAWIPYDARKESGDWIPQSVLIDDEIGELMLLTQKALGRNGRAVVTIDSCFSGTSTRSVSMGRSLVPSGVPIDSHPFQQLLQSGDDLAPIVVLSASKAGQKAADIQVGQNRMGAFTYAMLTTWPRLPEASTYADGLSSIQALMDEHPMIAQQPMLEGDGSIPIFTKRLLSEPYARVTKINGKIVTLDTNLFEFQLLGSLVRFQYVKDESSNPEEVGSGKIINVDGSTITVELLEELPKRNPKRFAAVVKKRAYLLGTKSVLFDVSVSADEQSRFVGDLKNNQEIVPSSSGFGADYRLRKTTSGFVLEHLTLLDLQESFATTDGFSGALENLQLKEFLLIVGAHNNHPDIFSINATHQGTELKLDEATPLDKGDKVDFTLRSTEPLEVRALSIDTKGGVCSLTERTFEMGPRSPFIESLDMVEPSKGIEYVLFIGTNINSDAPFDVRSIPFCHATSTRGVGTASLKKFFDKTGAQTNLVFAGHTILLPYRVVSE